MKIIVIIGRILFSFIFILTLTSHFSSNTIQYAASAGVPLASMIVPISGIIATLGGLSILLGFRAKFGAWLIVLFLIPVSFYMHRFWSVTDPGMQAMQKINFMKNMSLTGAALLIAYFGAGPLSFDNIKEKNRLNVH